MAKLGYIARDRLPWGATAISADYCHSTDMLSAWDNADSIGAAVVQKVDDHDPQIRFGDRNYSCKDHISSYKDAKSFVPGVNRTF